VRKLLVASQKGGVGKTTTSMNLAAAAALAGTRVLLLDADPLSNISTALNLADHPRRQSLRQAGIELPGAWVPNLEPGLDVLSPYEAGHCSDADFDQFLRALAVPAVQQCYGCMIVDVPPFLGGNPAQLIGICEDFLLVMRAEAMAYRTLPAFLELVQRSSRSGKVLPMRGILLTLPEGEEPGCRWELELRGRFGARALPEVIPHDESISKALQTGQIGSRIDPDSPAARQYHQLVGKLGLVPEANLAVEVARVAQALREAAAFVGSAVVAVPACVDPPQATTNATAEAPIVLPLSEPVKPASTPSHRLRRLNRSSESLRPVRPERASLPPVAPGPVLMKVVPAHVPPAVEPSHSAPIAATTPAAHALAQLWPLWILLGAVLGGGLRFVPLTASLLPILVGLGAALLVVVVLVALAAQERGALASANKGQGRTRSREVKKNAARSEPRKDVVSARLASLASTSKRARRDPNAN
jgi:chromosome partitioning protein